MFDVFKQNRVARRLALAATAASFVAVPAFVGGYALRDVPVIQQAHADTNLSNQTTAVQMVPASFADLAAKVTPAVVNISSTSGVNGNAGQSNYSAGKAGIVGLTKTLAKEFGRYDVTVNAVAFGYIQTRLTKPLSEGESGTIEVQGRQVKIGVQGGRIAAMNQMIPLGRGGLPEEAAGSVYLFCSPDSDYVSGQCLVVNGGL